jgi:hypothetical protein
LFAARPVIDHSTQITPWLSLSFWNQAFLHQFLSIVQCIGIVSAKEYLIGEAYKIFKILNNVYCVVFQGKNGVMSPCCAQSMSGFKMIDFNR